MSTKNNILLIVLAIAMSTAVWIIPSSISAEQHTQRLLLTAYNTNPTRSATVIKYCAGTSRENLISADQIATNQGYKNALAEQFTINGNDLMNMLAAGNTDNAVTDMQEDTNAFASFAGIYLVGFFLLMLIWSFLLCCCCCPGCCPSKCCQKDDFEQYSKCELYWPSIALILLLALIIITSGIGLTNAGGFKSGIQDSSCATAVMFDDIVNGNVTSDGTNFFIGITKLIQTINALNSNIAGVQTDIDKLGDSSMDTYITNVDNAITDVRKIPNNVDADGNATIQYTTPFNDAITSSTGTTDSLLNTIMGSSNNGGIVDVLFLIVNAMSTALTTIRDASVSFGGSISTFTSAIAAVNTDLDAFKSSINDMDASVLDVLGTLDGPKDSGTLVIQMFYGVALGAALIALIGVVLMTFCDQYKCRYLMYFACLILFFFAIVGFLMATIFSIIVPIMYWGCQWLTVTVGSSAGFDTNTAELISDATTRSYITVCLNGGTGKIIDIISPNTAATLNELSTTISDADSFNSSSQTAALTDALTNIQSILDDFNNGNTPDLTDAASIAILSVASDSSNFNTGCTAVDIDSWVVSNGNTSYIACTIASGATADSTTTGCTTTANLQTPASCSGCLDTTSLFKLYSSSTPALGDIKTALDLKYDVSTTSACGTLPTYLGNVWDNYYFVKLPAVQAMVTRYGTADTQINQVITDLGSINTTFTDALASLTASVDSITDPEFGMVAGLNCLLIGQNINLFVDSVCVTNFNTLYLTRSVMGTSSIGILFALCCIVCSGVRHFKHSERKDKISPNFMGGKNSFEDTDAAFRH